jgi:hypothetical protein
MFTRPPTHDPTGAGADANDAHRPAPLRPTAHPLLESKQLLRSPITLEVSP